MTETFSAFKTKWLRDRITKEQYIKCVRHLIRILGTSLQIDEVPILLPQVFTEAERLIQTYGIDFIDCFQIATIFQGRFYKLGPNSKSILITADRDLAKAAREEDVKVWECTTEPAPL